MIVANRMTSLVKGDYSETQNVGVNGASENSRALFTFFLSRKQPFFPEFLPFQVTFGVNP